MGDPGNNPERSGNTVPVQIDLARGSCGLRATVSVPNRPLRPRELVPLSLALVDTVTAGVVGQLAAEGHPVSCQKGCAACCRYLVHIAESEAYHLRDLVARLPEPRRSQVRERFAAARRRLEQAGLLATMQECQVWTLSETRERARDYHALRIPCPFLEDENCSIYPARPIACREYMVTSPPQNCFTREETPVRPVKMPISFFPALARFGVPAEARTQYRWVPLVLVLEWADTDLNQPRPGPDLLNEFLDQLEMEPVSESVP